MNDTRTDRPKTELRKGSRTNWVSNNPRMTLEQIRTGALLRIADAVEKLCEEQDRPAPEQERAYGLHVGWRGWYTRKGGDRWYRCKVVAFEDGEPVIKTEKGHYHRRPTFIYEYTTEDPTLGDKS